MKANKSNLTICGSKNINLADNNLVKLKDMIKLSADNNSN